MERVILNRNTLRELANNQKNTLLDKHNEFKRKLGLINENENN